MEFTLDELALATSKLPSGKARGPDGILNEVLSMVARAKPLILLKVYNACIWQSSFPAAWKEARLVHKGPGKPFESPSSFRPLSMLYTAGKTLERLILARLNRFLETAENPLSPLQFGFRTSAACWKQQRRRPQEQCKTETYA